MAITPLLRLIRPFMKNTYTIYIPICSIKKKQKRLLVPVVDYSTTKK